MLFILSNSNSPYFNLATEEFLLKNTQEEIFMLWRSEPCVVVGKHQNTLAEINYKYVRENTIKVARRLSGGGTVVHDLQNLNFTFIANGKEGKLIDFKKFVSPIIHYLKSIGIDARLGEKNDIRIGDLKISGNAEHVYKKRVLHHGTLLFNSDLSQLKQAIKVVPGTYLDNAVQSNRTTVTNIVDHLTKEMHVKDFVNGLSSHVIDISEINGEMTFSEQELNKISELVKDKYETEEWIFGYSPKYSLVKNISFKENNWDIELFVEKGKITTANILVNNEPHELSNKLIGAYHKYTEFFNIIEQSFPEASKKELDELIFCFF